MGIGILWDSIRQIYDIGVQQSSLQNLKTSFPKILSQKTSYIRPPHPGHSALVTVVSSMGHLQIREFLPRLRRIVESMRSTVLRSATFVHHPGEGGAGVD